MNAHKRHKIAKMARFMAGRSVAAPVEELKPVVLEVPVEQPVLKVEEPVVAEVVVTDVVAEAVIENSVPAEPVIEKPVVSKKKKGL